MIKIPSSPEDKLKELNELRKTREHNLSELRKSNLAKLQEQRKLDEIKSQDAVLETKIRSELDSSEALLEKATITEYNNLKKDVMDSFFKIKNTGKEKIRNKILFEMVYEALWVDDEVKQNDVKSVYEAFIDTIEFMKDSCPNSFDKRLNGVTNARVLESINTIVNETYDDVMVRYNKIMENARNANAYDEKLLDKLQFNMTDEEESKMDEKLKDAGKDQIVNLVKKKVLSVVQDEKKRAEKRAEVFSELDDALIDEDEEPTDDVGSDEEPSTDTDDVTEEPNDDVPVEPENEEEPEGDVEMGESFEFDGEEDVEEAGLNSFWKNLQKKKKRREDYKKKKEAEKKSGVQVSVEKRELTDDEKKKIKEMSGKIKDGFKEQIKNKKNKSVLKKKVQESVLRDLNRMGAVSIFESLNMVNHGFASLEIAKGAVENGNYVIEAAIPETVATIAMIQSLTQYTTMETLNTLNICNLTTMEATNLRNTLTKKATESRKVKHYDDIPLSLSGKL